MTGMRPPFLRQLASTSKNAYSRWRWHVSLEFNLGGSSRKISSQEFHRISHFGPLPLFLAAFHHFSWKEMGIDALIELEYQLGAYICSGFGLLRLKFEQQLSVDINSVLPLLAGRHRVLCHPRCPD
ncbi:hypothetical protein Tco_0425154 [Tanacetum coccineum]